MTKPGCLINEVMLAAEKMEEDTKSKNRRSCRKK